MEKSSDEDCISPASPNSPGVISDVDLTATVARQLVMSGDVELGAVVLDTNQTWDDEVDQVTAHTTSSSPYTDIYLKNR